jgi:hypothetical protein
MALFKLRIRGEILPQRAPEQQRFGDNIDAETQRWRGCGEKTIKPISGA